MDDNKIIDLYFARDERAIKQTNAKYGKLLHHISYRILHSIPDSDECVNDTYMKAWTSIPPKRPSFFSAFLAKITRNLSINRYVQNKSRTKWLAMDTVFEEVAECIPDNTGEASDDLALRDAINGFLGSLSDTSRNIFVKRYFYMMSIKEISLDMEMSVSNVKVNLLRTRERLKAHLEKAGINI